MIFDRISLVAAYVALKYVNDNDGRVTDILFNTNGYYGTKTTPRFKTLASLKSHIDSEFPYYHIDTDCDCGTGQDSILRLLSFSIITKNDVTQKEHKHAIFVNNMRKGVETAKEPQLNRLSVKKIAEVFASNLRLEFLKDNYICESYVQLQGHYVNPCDYITIVSNAFYSELITNHYYKTQNYDI